MPAFLASPMVEHPSSFKKRMTFAASSLKTPAPVSMDKSHLQPDSLLFELEDHEPSTHEENDEVNICPFSATIHHLTQKVEGAYHQSLRDDVTYFREQLMLEEGKVDIVDLACQLSSIGHEVVVRSAVGGGANCFRNLYHEFLCIRGKGDMDGVDLIVECNFREHFNIPCVTPRYQRLLASVPSVFVGTVEALAPIVQAVASEMNLAFASNDLTKPPWRNAQSMMSKWAPQRSKDWLPTSSPRSAAQSPPQELPFYRGSFHSDAVLRRLSFSEQPIHFSSLGCATVLTPIASKKRTAPLASSHGHDVLVGFSKSALSSIDFNASGRGSVRGTVS